MAFITLHGMDEAIANLNLQSGTLKSLLTAIIRSSFPTEESLREITAISAEDIIRQLWNVDRPEEIRQKKKNLSSLKSAINKELKELARQGKNPEGLIISRENVFTISEEQKNDILQKLGIGATLDPQDLLSVVRAVLDGVMQRGGSRQENAASLLKELDRARENIARVAGTGGDQTHMPPEETATGESSGFAGDVGEAGFAAETKKDNRGESISEPAGSVSAAAAQGAPAGPGSGAVQLPGAAGVGGEAAELIDREQVIDEDAQGAGHILAVDEDEVIDWQEDVTDDADILTLTAEDEIVDSGAEEAAAELDAPGAVTAAGSGADAAAGPAPGGGAGQLPGAAGVGGEAAELIDQEQVIDEDAQSAGHILAVDEDEVIDWQEDVTDDADILTLTAEDEIVDSGAEEVAAELDAPGAVTAAGSGADAAAGPAPGGGAGQLPGAAEVGGEAAELIDQEQVIDEDEQGADNILAADEDEVIDWQEDVTDDADILTLAAEDEIVDSGAAEVEADPDAPGSGAGQLPGAAEVGGEAAELIDREQVIDEDAQSADNILAADEDEVIDWQDDVTDDADILTLAAEDEIVDSGAAVEADPDAPGSGAGQLPGAAEVGGEAAELIDREQVIDEDAQSADNILAADEDEVIDWQDDVTDDADILTLTAEDEIVDSGAAVEAELDAPGSGAGQLPGAAGVGGEAAAELIDQEQVIDEDAQGAGHILAVDEDEVIDWQEDVTDDADILTLTAEDEIVDSGAEAVEAELDAPGAVTAAGAGADAAAGSAPGGGATAFIDQEQLIEPNTAIAGKKEMAGSGGAHTTGDILGEERNDPNQRLDLSHYIEADEALAAPPETLVETHDEYIAQILARFMPKFIKIPAGYYLTGRERPSPHERRAKKILLQNFYISQLPVTNDLFDFFVRETGYETDAERAGFGIVVTGRICNSTDPHTGRNIVSISRGTRSQRVPAANWRHPQGPDSALENKANHPVVQVSRHDALAFAAWAGKRLPSEDEWEAAARGPHGFLFPWGNEWHGELANTESSLTGDTTPVTRHGQLSMSPFGVYDLLGNVFEWTSTIAKAERPSTGNPIYVLKGGCWTSGTGTTAASRQLESETWSNIIGFRCAV